MELGWYHHAVPDSGSSKDRKVPTTDCTLDEALLWGPKMVAFLSILAECVRKKDKVVVFSQSLPTLDLMEKILQAQDWGAASSPNKGHPGNITPLSEWENGTHYYRIDGMTSMEDRHSLIESFNTEGTLNLWLLLVSTRTGGTGINLQGANRVILFDHSWNPAIDMQAVHRCHRMGQKKPVYVYRLVAAGSMENKVFMRQMEKERQSQSVVDNSWSKGHFTEEEAKELLAAPDTNKSTYVHTDECADAVLRATLENPHLARVVAEVRDHTNMLQHEQKEMLSTKEVAAAEEELEKRELKKLVGKTLDKLRAYRAQALATV